MKNENQPVRTNFYLPFSASFCRFLFFFRRKRGKHLMNEDRDTRETFCLSYIVNQNVDQKGETYIY